MGTDGTGYFLFICGMTSHPVASSGTVSPNRRTTAAENHYPPKGTKHDLSSKIVTMVTFPFVGNSVRNQNLRLDTLHRAFWSEYHAPQVVAGTPF